MGMAWHPQPVASRFGRALRELPKPRLRYSLPSGRTFINPARRAPGLEGRQPSVGGPAAPPDQFISSSRTPLPSYLRVEERELEAGGLN